MNIQISSNTLSKVLCLITHNVFVNKDICVSLYNAYIQDNGLTQLYTLNVIKLEHNTM